MDDFTSKLGVPNMFGLIQGPANAIAPRKRPLSAMTPTIVLENGKLRYVLGSPGGPRIITTVANIFLSATEGGLNIQQAVDAPALPPPVPAGQAVSRTGLSNGHAGGAQGPGLRSLAVSKGHWSDGECIAVDPKTGELSGGQDHRNHFGKAAGY
jgi:gamma-glutamyltranspeptidase/glutathione hydrolase